MNFFKVQKLVISNNRSYHSENVFGYRKKVSPSYQVSEEILQNRASESKFYRLVTAYRQHGHKYANVNPIARQKVKRYTPELDPKRYGFHENDIVNIQKGIVNHSQGQKSIGETVNFLNNVYSNYIGAEFLHLENEQEQEWFAEQLENLPNVELDDAIKIDIVRELQKCQAFENFLAKKFASVKRYGGEGAETMLTFFNETFKMAANDTVEEIVIGMPHRGRLSLLTGLLNYPPVQMFYKMKGNSIIPTKYEAIGDVLTHVISSTDISYNDKSVHVSVLYNPSHLEAVNPVSMGKARAKHLAHKDGDYGNGSTWGEKVVNIQVHGDAALIGQGINQETVCLSQAPNFEIGGSIHLAVNNQVGFTTPADRGRSSRYCTDVAKIIAAPVLHVNGSQPEEVLKVSRLAFNYQRKFRKDIFVDLNVFRKWGHNEMDDPTFTNPALYQIIRSRKSIPDQYAEQLVKEGVLGEQQIKDIYDEHFDWLNEELKIVDDHQPTDDYFKKHWAGFCQPAPAVTLWDTGVDEATLRQVGKKSVTTPNEFVKFEQFFSRSRGGAIKFREFVVNNAQANKNVHPTIQRGHVKNRLLKISEGQKIDWATAEALAIGSLLYEGYNVRISGEDVGRGTFSQRHAMLVDQQTNEVFIPLNNLHPKQNAFLEVANSILSEEAVIGFEYGMSIENPKNLIIWEAQFGDFANGAQIIFDTFIAPGEAKWLWQTGLTILLPHGYDGVGPEHSSARIERYLQLTDSKEDAVDGDNVNMQVVHPSTPAQYFHLLRRQMVRNYRKPLIIIAPKTLLRSSQCVSSLQDMTRGTHFKPVLGDRTVSPSKVQRVILTSGKHYYSLVEHRQAEEIDNVAIVRLESLVPFPTAELVEEFSQYRNAKDIIWCQEEPKNGGSWNFVKRRFENLVGKRINYCGRDTLPATAVGIKKIHNQQAAEIIENAFL